MKPIGYWLIHLHGLLESSFETLLTAEDLTRRHWQVLNTITAGVRTRNEVDDALAPFGPQGHMVDELTARGWLSSGDPFELTAEGKATHARLKEAVSAQRQRVTEGISEEDYLTTHRVLERMAANLEE